MQITNINNQFRVANGSDIEFYSFAQIKAVSWRKDSVTSNYILLVYFTANDLNNPAEFDLTKITNQAGWTNNAAGIQQAVADVSGWMSTSGAASSLATATNAATMTRGTGSVTVTASVKSISIYNAHASAPGTINIGGSGAVNLEAGETVNFDAGGNANKFPASHFVVDGAGTADMLIIYVV